MSIRKLLENNLVQDATEVLGLAIEEKLRLADREENDAIKVLLFRKSVPTALFTILDEYSSC